MPQRPFMMVPLNCDPCNVAGVLDQLQVDGVWIAHLTIKDGESAEYPTFARKQGARPNGANTIGLEEVTIVVPKRVVEDVGNEHRLPPIDSRAAGCAVGANRRAPDAGSKSRKTRCGYAMEMLTVGIGEPDGA